MGLTVVPMFANPEGEVVEISSDVPGNFPTKAQLDEMRRPAHNRAASAAFIF
jgi:hypothetical protein